MLELRPGASISEDEISYEFSRASGPGGQHVNRTASRAVLCFDVFGSPSLTPEQKARILDKLGGRVSSEGVLRVARSNRRSQKANRDEALRAFALLLAQALEPETPRVPTKAGREVHRRRLKSKRLRSRLKQQRGRVGEDAQ